MYRLSKGLSNGALRMCLLPLFACFPGISSCSDGATGPDSGARTIETEAFTVVVHGEVSNGEIDGLLNALEFNSSRIEDHLQVRSMPHITIRVWASNRTRDWYSFMESSLGTVYEGATGYIWGEKEMRLHLNPESPVEVVHEYAHLVSMQVNPTIPNNPRWLWEAIATYEAGQLDHPGSWQIQSLTFPGFSALNQFNSVLPYRWGYLIAEAIIEGWGREGYLALIESNGRIEETLGVSEASMGNYLEVIARGYL